MKNNHLLWVNIIITLLVFTSIATSDDKAVKVISKLQKKYTSIKDATISFTQEVKFGATGAEQVFHGKFYMKKGNKYRIEMEDQIIVTNGKSVWRYTEYNKQLLIDHYREDPASFSPENILLNIPAQFTPVVIGNEKISDKQTLIIKLSPRDEKNTLRWIKVWIDEENMISKKIQLMDISNNLFTYNIEGALFDTGLSAGLFEFKPPENVNVIDLR